MIELFRGQTPRGDGARETHGVHGQQDGLLDFRFGRAVVHRPPDMTTEGRLKASTGADADLDQCERFGIERANTLDRFGDRLVRATEGGKSPDKLPVRSGHAGLLGHGLPLGTERGGFHVSLARGE